MSDLKAPLRELGWSEELIDAFFSGDPSPTLEATESPDVKPRLVDVTDVTLDIEETGIGAGTEIKLIS